MNTESIYHSIANQRLKLDFWQASSHYSIVIIMSIAGLMFVFFPVKAYLDGIVKPINSTPIYFSLVCFLVGILFYMVQRKRLKFMVIETELSSDKLNMIIEKVATEMEWIPVFVDDKVYIAKTQPDFFSGSWGEQITIIFHENKLLVNSICDPDKQTSVVSFGRNKRNVNWLSQEIQKENMK
ncbi:MAG: hypothetical protein MUC87_03765 [Bacteroidia bacterium]|jgi:uncharacterized membrane protein YhdT|nr:hypothetical protein [Bacteroidia bacterium]